MAAAAAQPLASIDLKSQASYAVRLGDSIVRPTEARQLTSIRYNHVPHLNERQNTNFKLQSGLGDQTEQLTLKDGEDRYEYSGQAAAGLNWFALVFQGNGKNTETVLERIESLHDFNLVSTPAESDAEKLAAEFPQLSFDDDDDLFGHDEDTEQPADPNNPWDYRNYLKASSKGTAPQRAEREQSTTPVIAPLKSREAPRAASSTPVSRPVRNSQNPLLAQKKRKAQAPSKADSKRVKAGTEPPRTSSEQPTRAAQELPRVRIDRKASMRRPSLDDSGELILENETPISEKPPKQPSAMSLALSGQLGQGPISLRSAASSPASRMASPMPQRPEGMDDGEEFQFGDSESSPETPKQRSSRTDEDYFGGGNEVEEPEADADVEDLELPSPAQARHNVHASEAVDQADDDDDDLDKQLALAMAEDDDAPGPPPADSDEESEEE
jgi:hypothetical protein